MKGATTPRNATGSGRRLIAIGLTLLLTSFFATPTFASPGDPYVTLDGVTWTGQNSVGDSGCELVLHEGDRPLSDYRFEYWDDNGGFISLTGLTVSTYTFDLSAYEGERVKIEVKGWLIGDPDSPLGSPLFNEHITIDCDAAPTTGSISVVKDVVGDYDGEQEFAFAGTCTLPHLIAHETFTLADGEKWTFDEDIPEYLDGSPCELEETGTNGADSVAYSLDGSPLTPGADGKVHFELSNTDDLVITVTNTFGEPPMSTLTVVKDAVNYTGTATFPFEGSCVYEEEAATPLSFALADDGSFPTGEVDTGTQCRIRETDSRGASSVVYRLDGNVVAPATDGYVDIDLFQARGYTLTVTNAFPTPTVTDDGGGYVPPPVVVLTPDIELVKVADVARDIDGFRTIEYDADEPLPTISYLYTVTNTGETALTGLVLIDTPLGPVTLEDTSLAVGGSTTGTMTHTLTLDDVDAKFVTNDATVTGKAPNGAEVTDSDGETVYVVEVEPAELLKPEIALTKVALVEPDENGDKVVEWSKQTDAPVITYEYTITNTGENALAGLALEDDILGVIELPTAGLAVGEILTVTMDHTVTGDEGALGSIVNVATVTALSPDGDEVTATATETVLLVEVLALILEPEEILPVTGAPLGVFAVIAGLALLLGFGSLGVERRAARRR